MRILFFSRGWPSKNSPQWGCFERDQALALKRAGHDVVIMSIDGRLGFYHRTIGIVHNREDDIDIFNLFLFPLPVFTICGLTYFIRALLALFLYKRIVKEVGNVDIVYSHYLFNTYSTLFIKRIYKVPIVAIEHWSKLNTKRLSFPLHSIGKIAYSNADQVISVSKTLHNQLKKFWGIDSRVIYNMCSDLFSFQDRLIKSNVFTFVSVGRLVKHKRFDMLIQAFINAHFPQNVKLYIIGSGKEEDYLRKIISDASMGQQIILLGAKSKEDLSQILADCNVFVLASKGETFGVVCIEALMSGLPVISTRCGGPEEFITPQNGRLVPLNDVSALTSTMQEVYNDISSFNSKQIAAECSKKFSSKEIVKQLESIFNALIIK